MTRAGKCRGHGDTSEPGPSDRQEAPKGSWLTRQWTTTDTLDEQKICPESRSYSSAVVSWLIYIKVDLRY
jgi:hypothetical protein